jgi:hypothetical protein
MSLSLGTTFKNSSSFPCLCFTSNIGLQTLNILVFDDVVMFLASCFEISPTLSYIYSTSVITFKFIFNSAYLSSVSCFVADFFCVLLFTVYTGFTLVFLEYLCY